MTFKTAAIAIAGIFIAGAISKLITPKQEIHHYIDDQTVANAKKYMKKANSGITEDSVIRTYDRKYYEKKYGIDLRSDYKINLWENSLYWGKGKGKVVGYTLPGNELVVLTVNNQDILVSDRSTRYTGWIGKIQIDKGSK